MLFSPFEWMVATRYLRAKRKEGFISVITWFSLLGICLGVATLIIVMSVMNGFRHELVTRFIGLDGHITIHNFQYGLDGYDRILPDIEKVDGVVTAIPLVDGQVMVSANQVARGAMVRGMSGANFIKRPVLSNSVDLESMRRYTNGEGVLIGHRLARSMGINVGTEITLVSPSTTNTAFGSIPRAKRYEIVGLFDVGMFEYDDNMIYMPLDQAQNFFKKKGKATAIELTVEDAENVEAYLPDVIRSVSGWGLTKTWRETRASFYNALAVERNVMFLILTLIIVVAAFNIISSQIMLVKDKGRGIAVLRTMGASRTTIMKIFFLTGSSIGVIGSALGGLLGIAFATNIEAIRQFIQGLSGAELFSAEIYFLSRLPAKIDQTEVIMVMVIALSLSFIASIYPAWRAARLDPVEVLRYE